VGINRKTLAFNEGVLREQITEATPDFTGKLKASLTW
jgi:hypothetical protein